MWMLGTIVSAETGDGAFGDLEKFVRAQSTEWLLELTVNLKAQPNRFSKMLEVAIASRTNPLLSQHPSEVRGLLFGTMPHNSRGSTAPDPVDMDMVEKVSTRSGTDATPQPEGVLVKDTLLSGKFTAYVELPGDPDTKCQTNSCVGSIEFLLTCSTDTKVRLQAETISPDRRSNSFFVQLDPDDEKPWHIAFNASNAWEWSGQSPPVIAAAGEHVMKLNAREDGIKIRTLRLSEGWPDCTISALGPNACMISPPPSPPPAAPPPMPPLSDWAYMEVNTAELLKVALASDIAYPRIVLSGSSYTVSETLLLNRTVVLESKTGSVDLVGSQENTSVIEIMAGSHWVQLSGLNVTGGTSTWTGGGVSIKSGHVTFIDCSIHSNKVNGAVGGGLKVDGGIVAFTRCGIFGNKDGVGGGVVLDNAEVTFTDCEISGNEANGMDNDGFGGGGLSINGGNVQLDNCNIHSNSVIEFRGGGGAFIWDGTVTFTTCNIYNNLAATEKGGGLLVYGGNVQVKNCSIHSNTAKRQGGGAYIMGGTVIFTSCHIYNNQAIGLNSGSDGGGLAITSGNVTLNGCDIYNNTATREGGGAFIEDDSGLYGLLHPNVTFTSCQFYNNQAKYGGALRIDYGIVTLINCNIYNNKATNDGGGFKIMHNTADVTLDGSSVYDNFAGQSGNDDISGIFTALNMPP